MKSRWFCERHNELEGPQCRYPGPHGIPRSRRLALLALLLMIVAAGSRPLIASAPDWLRAAAQTPPGQYPKDTSAVVLLDSQVTTITESGEAQTLYRRAYRILRPEGHKYGIVSIPFDQDIRPGHLKAWSIPSTGNDYEVGEKDSVETSLFSESLYDDTREKLLDIPAAEPGSVIGYEFEQRRRPSILQDVWQFQLDLPVRRSRFELRLPAGWEYRVFWVNHAAEKPEEISQNGWGWELSDLPAVEPEPSMPAWSALAGRLGVTYYPRSKVSSAESLGSWPMIARWYGRLTVDRRQATPAIRQKVADLTANASKPLDQIRALAAFVQADIRYVAIEVGIGGFQPHSAADVFANHYGDCKDKATLLSTMLAVAGVKSYYVLIDDERGVVVPEVPSALSFDHVILAIQVPESPELSQLWSVQEQPKLGKLLFFDPTDPYVPVGYLPAELQANYGLLVTDSGGELVKLPLPPPAANRLLRTADLLLTAKGTLTGSVQEMRWGAPAAELRARLLEASQVDRQKIFETLLAQFLSGSVLQSATAGNLDKLDAPLALQYSFAATDYAKLSGDLFLVKPRVLGSKLEDVLDAKERKYPVEFPTTTSQGDVFDITLPDGYTVDELPDPVDISSGATSYRSKTVTDGHVLHYTRLYQITDIRISTENLAQLKQFYQQVAADERSIAVFKKK